MQKDLFQVEGSQPLPLPDADIRYYPHFLSRPLADQLFNQLKEDISWQSAHIQLYGRQVTIPRLQAWYGDAGAIYRYSGLQLNPLPWLPELMRLKSLCDAEAGIAFNGVLANLYRNQQDSMGMHADDEPELGSKPIIASISLGQERPFILKHKQTGQQHKIALPHGSLLMMQGETQSYWQHGIPKSRIPLGERINLTFRHLINTNI